MTRETGIAQGIGMTSHINSTMNETVAVDRVSRSVFAPTRSRLVRVLGAVSLLAASHCVSALGLEQAVERARLHSAAVDSRVQEKRAERHGLRAARAEWFPALTIDSGIRRSNDRFPYTESLRSGSYGLTLNQPLYTGGRISSGVAISESSVERASSAHDLELHRAGLQAVEAYLGVVYAEQFLDRRRDAWRDLDEHERNTRRAFELGSRTRPDVAQAVAEKQRSWAMLERARDELQHARWALEGAIGEFVESVAPVTIPDEVPFTLDEARRRARMSSPDVAVREAERLVARHSAAFARSSLAPQVAAYARVERRHEIEDFRPSAEYGWNRIWSIGVYLSVPLDLRGREHSWVSAADARAIGAEFALEEARRVAEQSASRSWHALSAAIGARSGRQEAVAASRAALEGIRSEAEHGARTAREVMSAARDVIDREIELLSGEHGLVLAWYRLWADVGVLPGDESPAEVPAGRRSAE